MYILDTDHLVILQRQSGEEYRNLVRNLEAHDRKTIYVTIVSFLEQVAGAQTYISRANNAASIVRGFSMLDTLLNLYANAQVLQFGEAAAEIFNDHRRQKIRVGTMDLRIASIAIANQMTVVTRNQVDFSRVPNLSLEDWTST